MNNSCSVLIAAVFSEFCRPCHRHWANVRVLRSDLSPSYLNLDLLTRPWPFPIDLEPRHSTLLTCSGPFSSRPGLFLFDRTYPCTSLVHAIMYLVLIRYLPYYSQEYSVFIFAWTLIVNYSLAQLVQGNINNNNNNNNNNTKHLIIYLGSECNTPAYEIGRDRRWQIVVISVCWFT